MKRIALVLLLCILSVNLFADTGSMDYMYENSSFAAVLDAINLQVPYNELKEIFSTSINIIKNDVATRLRLKIAYYDYLNSVDYKTYKKEIKAGLEDCYKDLEELEKSNTITVIKKSLEFLLYGVDYCITGNTSKGLKSLKNIKELFEEYGDDQSVRFLYAQYKSRTPKIGGGDPSQAISILTELLKGIDNNANAVKYAIFSELSYLYQKADPEKSTYYSEKAKSLY